MSAEPPGYMDRMLRGLEVDEILKRKEKPRALTYDIVYLKGDHLNGKH
jgi:hypothetical protein